MERKRFLITLVSALSLLICAGPISAHHGAAQFDAGKKVTAKGIVTEWFWANPHCFLRFDVKGDDGQLAHWIAEAQSGPNIVPLGFTKQSFKAGDVVTVTMEPVKNGRPLGRLLSVVLADGTKLSTGNN